jgi:hypothetical protein
LIRHYERYSIDNELSGFRKLTDVVGFLILAVMLATIATAAAIHGVK